MINVPSLTLEENRAIVDEAHRRGLKVACHAYGGEGLRNCLAAGVDMPMRAIVGVTGRLHRWSRRAGRPVRLLREWGMRPAQALRMATTNAAESLNF
jgi:imidazolonepropionase-like amidohydrolase